MKFSKVFAAATAIVVAASASFATELVGGPILSDGNNAIAMKKEQSVYKIDICGANYWLSDRNSISIYENALLPRLRNNGGYIYYHTTTSGKKYYACAWGRYEHLHGKVF